MNHPKPERGQLFFHYICQWLSEEFKARDCDCVPHAFLIDHIGMDSLDIHELALYCDDRFGFDRHSPEADAIIPLTVMDVVDYCIINNRFNKCERDPDRPGYRIAKAWPVPAPTEMVRP